MPQAKHLRTIPVAQMHKAIRGQNICAPFLWRKCIKPSVAKKPSSELIQLSIGLLPASAMPRSRNDEKYKRYSTAIIDGSLTTHRELLQY
jgi:hypothetical protein